LELLAGGEFESIVSDWGRLKALGVIRDDGVIDYGLALKILALASRDEYLKNAILRFVVENSHKDLRRMLGISFAGVGLGGAGIPNVTYPAYLRLLEGVWGVLWLRPNGGGRL
jgi:hypothetical protein